MSGDQPKPGRGAVVAAQDAFHHESHEYDPSSPHLRHSKIRNAVVRDLTEMVQRSREATGGCRVIEVGAGHGTFTRTLVEAGAEVTVTEASRASADLLRERYRDEPRVTVFYDESGEDSLELSGAFDLVVCVSVLHHIPDYVGFIRSMIGKLRDGGSFYSVQDPLWYARLSRVTRTAHSGAYFAWRLGQGDYLQGLGTRMRRLRGVYNDSPSDLVEYHVVRDGVDEEAILELLSANFDRAEVFGYWSTQAPVFQRLGEKAGLRTNFGVRATGFHPHAG